MRHSGHNRINICIGNVSPWQRGILENRFDSDEGFHLLRDPNGTQSFESIANDVDLRLIGFNAANLGDEVIFSNLLESSASIPTIALIATAPKESYCELPMQIKERVLIPTDLNDHGQSVAHFLLALDTAIEHALPQLKKEPRKTNLEKPERMTRLGSIKSVEVPDLIVIGSSTGGPKALQILLQSLPADIPVPIVIAQHMPSTFTKSLAKQLNQNTSFRVEEAKDREALKAGHVYIAPGDRHMRLKRTKHNEVTVQISDEKPVNFCRPSVDVLFRSAALEYGSRCIAVVLTGMGMDGFAGSTVLSECGASIVVQDEETSVVWGMPGNIAAAGLANHVLGIEQIGGTIASMLSSKCPV